MLRDDRGVGAIEFAIVAVPFFLFTLGLLGFGLYFFTNSSLEYGVEVASRKIRTGELNSAGTTRSDNQLTVGEFRNMVCKAAGSYINCSKLSIIVQHADAWSSLSPQACSDKNGSMAGSSGASGDLLSKYAGTANAVVLVTLCYKWDLAQSFPFLKLGSGPGGSGPAIIQVATAFKSEPYG